MPPVTGLSFYRKKQTIQHFELERPKSLKTFRQCVSDALVSVESRIDLLQQGSYGPDKNVEAEIKRLLPPLEIVMKYTKMSYLMCATQLDDIFLMYEKSNQDPTMVVDFDKDAVNEVKDCIDRIVQYLKVAFTEIVKDLNSLNNYMTRYCLSFCGKDGDDFLHTATSYERQRTELAEAVKFNLHDVTEMADSFETKGLVITELGLVARQLAEKCNCKHVPFLVIIPQAFENVKNSITGLRRWLRADDGYADFIHFDIADLETRKAEHERQCRQLQDRCSISEHKVKKLKRDLAEFTADTKRFQKVEVAFQRELKQIITQTKGVMRDLDIKLLRIDDTCDTLDIPLANSRSSVYQVFQRLEREMPNLNKNRPKLYKQLQDISKRYHNIAEHDAAVLKTETALTDAELESTVAKKELKQNELVLERMKENLPRLKGIYRFKTTSEVMKKIFHNMPLTSRNAAGNGIQQKIDKLDLACLRVAGVIEGDWARLYRALPFYPARGRQTIAQDVDEISKQCVRQNKANLCRQCLQRWRRMHTRARIDDLTTALLSIRRKDIVELIEEDTARRKRKPMNKSF